MKKLTAIFFALLTCTLLVADEGISQANDYRKNSSMQWQLAIDTNPPRKYVTNSWLRLCHINPLSLAIVLLWPPHSERLRFDLALPRSALCNLFA